MPPLLCFPRILIQTLLLLIFTLPFAQAKATPVTFSFTGTITQALYEHVQSGAPSQVHAEWLGKPISGDVSIDLELAREEQTHDSSRKAFANDPAKGVSAADWVKFSLMMPDGTTWSLPGSVPPSAVYYSLLDLDLPELHHDESTFYLLHGLETFLYPSLLVQLVLSADGSNSHHLLNGLDLNNLVVQPQFANLNSSGSIVYYVAPDDTRSYTFTIDSFTRATSHVPDPDGLLLAIIGAAGVLLSRLRRA
jgi:hypothetical protein